MTTNKSNPAFRWFFLLTMIGFAASAAAQTSSSLPLVSVLAVDSSAGETGTNLATFRISRNSTNAPLTVAYTLTGSASNGVDYTALPLSVVIPDGAPNVLVHVHPIDDSHAEPQESAILTLNTNSHYLRSTNFKATAIIADNDNQLPLVSILSPTNQSSFAGPTNIVFRVEASDPDGWLRRVEFYKNQMLIGSVTGSEHTNVYTFIWSNAPPGSYSVQARAIDNFEASRYSAPVAISVTGPPFVSVSIIDGVAAESGSAGTNTATFKISRNTGTNAALTVLFALSGTASNGVDYAHLGDAVTIPAGALFTTLLVRPIDDFAVEGNENVLLSLRAHSEYLLGEVRSASITIQDNDFTNTNSLPIVRIVNPTNNATFAAPTNLVLSATAHDTNGWVQKVSFFANGQLLGIVSNNNTTASAPANLFHFAWNNVPVGEHILTAKATDNNNAVATSDPVRIVVQEAEVKRTIVTVAATDAEATEATTTTVLNPAIFTFNREGATNIPLTVYYHIGGSAQNGVDYHRITNTIVIPAGHHAASIQVRALDDQHAEGNETVILTVEEPACIAIFPPPPECYLVGTPRSATAVIIDNDATNAPPLVHVTSPTNGAVFHAPLNLPIEAQASDSDGTIVHVDFFGGDRFLGRDTTAPYSAVWTNVLPGSYTITARATDNLGAMRMSEPRKISVVGTTQTLFAFRKLPIWYVPGVRLVAQIRCEPRTNTLSYVVEDRPPTNWVVGTISHGGVLSADGKIQFGPFNDNLSRTLTYEVTPPATAHGEKKFIGSATANDIVTPVGGVQWIVHAPPHPADRNPTNSVMTLEEVNQYALAWRRNERWPISPNPIPVSYVSRAGYLWKMGGGYVVSHASPTPMPPLLWVSTNAPVTLAGASEEAVWTTNRFGTAISSMPTNYSIGVPFTVSINVTPAAGMLAYAAEERIPSGWTVTNISHEGIFCPLTAKVRWGVFLNSTNRTLTYQVIPTSTNAPNIATFAGVVSFDGMNVPITGQRRTYRATTISPARLESIKQLSDGNRLLTFQGEPGVVYTLEGSTNLVDWAQMEVLLNNDGVLQYIDVSADPVKRFYRAAPQE